MKCRLCGSGLVEKFYGDYFRCSRCKYVFIDEDLLPSADFEKSRYDLHENTIDNEGYVSMLEDFILWCGEVKGLRILDFGCGPGPVLAELLGRYGADVSLYDPFYFDDKSVLDEQYDLVVSTETFEHLHYPSKDLRVIASVLKPDGFVKGQTQFYPSAADEFADWYYVNDKTHVGFFNEDVFRFLSPGAEVDNGQYFSIPQEDLQVFSAL